MQLKRYEAKSINEAMGKIKHDLGADAVVLSTKRLKGEKKHLIEVIAARDADLVTMGRQEVTHGEKASSDVYSTIRADVDELKSLMHHFLRGTNICAELAELKDHFHTFFDLWGIRKNGKLSSYLSKAYYHLISTGITKQQACQLMETLQKNNSPDDLTDYGDTLQRLENMMRQTIERSFGPRKADNRICAFIGPTGTGKTTTLAKLVAHHLFDRKANVGIVTMDTYRIGATDQLRKYADIMGVPIEVAKDKASLERVIRRLSERDMILVDTPGRSMRDEGHLLKLKDALSSVPGIETHLVLSITSSHRCMMDAARRFGMTDYDTIIFTKLDDTADCGTIYSIIEEMKKPVSYVTNGQNVPQDISEVEPGMLARIIMNHGFDCHSDTTSH
ncbi:MAG TPA: flagellar biosynthesis protein FlhF [Deltaproteobacteria bacterium]|nr:flagellar biosynthesis protein FlhF [Deltaproteobacteria bacterium]